MCYAHNNVDVFCFAHDAIVSIPFHCYFSVLYSSFALNECTQNFNLSDTSIADWTKCLPGSKPNATNAGMGESAHSAREPSLDRRIVRPTSQVLGSSDSLRRRTIFRGRANVLRRLSITIHRTHHPQFLPFTLARNRAMSHRKDARWIAARMHRTAVWPICSDRTRVPKQRPNTLFIDSIRPLFSFDIFTVSLL